MLNSNVENLLKASENEAWPRKRTTCFRVLQYAGGIVMVFSLLVGAAAMFVGYYGRKMIQVVRPIRDFN